MLQARDYLHYSDCECAVGDGRKELCYSYTVGKHAGWGILSVLLGILTSCLTYFLVFYVIEKLRNMCNNKEISKSDIIDKDASLVDNELNSVNAITKASLLKELTSPTKRFHNCWACDVKYNHAQPPVFYARERRLYMYTH